MRDILKNNGVMIMSDKISIIVPSFNEEKNIERCIDSILNQTFSEFEIICVDDGSTDNTFKILENYSDKDKRIKIFKNPEKGVSTARNFGLNQVSGNYICFVDSDDFIHPQMLEFLYRAIEENGCEMSVCGYERVRGFKTESFEYNCRECTCDEFISFTDNNYVLDNEMKVSSVCMKMIERSLVEKLRFEKYVLGEDTVFCSKLWSASKKVCLVDLPLYCYFINHDSVTHISYSDKKWLDLIKTRFIAYENYKGYNKKISDFYFRKGISQINYYRFFSKGTETEVFYKTETKKLYKKYSKQYYKDNGISVTSKLLFFVFYHIPVLYKMYRKHYYGNEK